MPVMQDPKNKGKRIRVSDHETSRIQILKEGGWAEVEDTPPVENPAPAGVGTHVPPESSGGSGEVEATDAARSLAEEKGVNLATVRGTGAEGRVTKADVEAAAPKDISA